MAQENNLDLFVGIVKATNLRNAVALMFLILVPSPGRPQTISFGLSAGTPVNNLVTAANGQLGTTRRYTFGPALRVGLPHDLGFDVEFLYKQLEAGFVPDPTHAVVHRVELPALFRYAFSRLPAHPLVHAGMSFNRVIAVDGPNVCAQGREFYCIGGKTVAELRHRHTHGLVLGSGLDFGWGRVILLAATKEGTRLQRDTSCIMTKKSQIKTLSVRQQERPIRTEER